VADLRDHGPARFLGVVQVRVRQAGVAPLGHAEDRGGALRFLGSELSAAAGARLTRSQIEDPCAISRVDRFDQRTGASQLHVVAVRGDGQHIYGHQTFR
jgi:hypothetical protein